MSSYRRAGSRDGVPPIPDAVVVVVRVAGVAAAVAVGVGVGLARVGDEQTVIGGVGATVAV